MVRKSFLVVMLLCASVGANAATVVNVDGQDYLVDSFFGSYVGNEALLQSQVWWGEATTANSFRNAILDSGDYDVGRYNFAWSWFPEDMQGDPIGTVSVLGINNGVSFNGTNPESFDTNYFVATAVPIPAAVWLFGSALAGLGWMRRKQTV